MTHEKPIILLDIDGTIANNDHRQHHIEPKQYQHGEADPVPKDWKTFFSLCFDDPPIRHVLTLVDAIDRDQIEIWVVTGRPEDCKYDTIEWLRKHHVRYEKLIMRPQGNNVDDGILKPSWLEDGTIPKERVLLALDDRNRVVKGWRDAGIPCLQVAEGNF